MRMILKNETKQAISDIPSKRGYLGCQKGQFLLLSQTEKTREKVAPNKLYQISPLRGGILAVKRVNSYYYRRQKKQEKK